MSFIPEIIQKKKTQKYLFFCSASLFSSSLDSEISLLLWNWIEFESRGRSGRRLLANRGPSLVVVLVEAQIPQLFSFLSKKFNQAFYFRFTFSLLILVNGVIET